MPNLLQYFNKDFNQDIAIDTTFSVQMGKYDSNKTLIENFSIEIQVKIRHHLNSSARIITFYINETPFVFQIIKSAINDLNKVIDFFNPIVFDGNYYNDTVIGKDQSVYSKRIYFYSESNLNQKEIDELNEYCEKSNISITLRGEEYVKKKK